jgi:predicted ester cyclase
MTYPFPHFYLCDYCQQHPGQEAKDFVTPDITYHGMGEEVKGLDEFKKWVAEDLSAFPDMKITILDDFGDQNKIAIR